DAEGTAVGLGEVEPHFVERASDGVKGPLHLVAASRIVPFRLEHRLGRADRNRGVTHVDVGIRTEGLAARVDEAFVSGPCWSTTQRSTTCIYAVDNLANRWIDDDVIGD